MDTTTNTDLGMVCLDNGTASLTTSALSAGDHLIRAFYNGDGNFTLSLDSLMETITPAPLTVTVANASKVYGQNDSASLTGTIAGIQNGDPITAAYSSTGSGTGATPGMYAIGATLSDGGTGKLAQDYKVTMTPGTLTVNLDGTTMQVVSSASTSNGRRLVQWHHPEHHQHRHPVRSHDRAVRGRPPVSGTHQSQP